jgi:hypothetical protein
MVGSNFSVLGIDRALNRELVLTGADYRPVG